MYEDNRICMPSNQKYALFKHVYKSVTNDSSNKPPMLKDVNERLVESCLSSFKFIVRRQGVMRALGITDSNEQNESKDLFF